MGRLAPQKLPDAAGELVAEQVPLRRLAIKVDGRHVVLGLPSTSPSSALGLHVLGTRPDRDLSRTLPCSSAETLAAHRTGRRVRGDVEVAAVLATDQALARIED